MPSSLRIARRFVALIALAFLLPACREDDKPPAPAPKPSAHPPVDKLAPGELRESDVDAFGLEVPKGLDPLFRGPRRVEAQGRIPAERVANYVRKRTKAQSVELGAARTVFDQARVLGVDNPKLLRIEVITVRQFTRLVVKDLTPPRVDPDLTPEERWKRHGFDKDGKLIDPDKMM